MQLVTRAIAIMSSIAAFTSGQVQASSYGIVSGTDDICPELAKWADGKPSLVNAVPWQHFEAKSPSLPADLAHLALWQNVSIDAVFVFKTPLGSDVTFIRSKGSAYDYRDNLVSVASGGRQTCFVNGAINGNPLCQDELHEQLPSNCAACDTDFAWRPEWRLRTELLMWRDTVYAADIISNGPYVVLWKSPASFRLEDESAPPDQKALCVLKR